MIEVFRLLGIADLGMGSFRGLLAVLELGVCGSRPLIPLFTI